jgi:hypothetical protein
MFGRSRRGGPNGRRYPPVCHGIRAPLQARLIALGCRQHRQPHRPVETGEPTARPQFLVDSVDSHRTVGNRNNLHNLVPPAWWNHVVPRGFVEMQARPKRVMDSPEKHRIAGSCQTATLESVMSLSTECQIHKLPKRLPMGTVYVVEGRGGQHGDLRVSSRYVLMPGGQKVEISAELGSTHSPRHGLQRSFGSESRTGSRIRKNFGPGKKFVLVPGTRPTTGR